MALTRRTFVKAVGIGGAGLLATPRGAWAGLLQGTAPAAAAEAAPPPQQREPARPRRGRPRGRARRARRRAVRPAGIRARTWDSSTRPSPRSSASARERRDRLRLHPGPARGRTDVHLSGAAAGGRTADLRGVRELRRADRHARAGRSRSTARCSSTWRRMADGGQGRGRGVPEQPEQPHGPRSSPRDAVDGFIEQRVRGRAGRRGADRRGLPRLRDRPVPPHPGPARRSRTRA